MYSVAIHEGEQGDDSPSNLQKQFLEFLSGYRIEGEFIYRWVVVDGLY